MPKRKRSYNNNNSTYRPKKRARPSYARDGRMRKYIASNPRTGGFSGQELKFYDGGLNSAALTAATDAAGGEHNPSATLALSTMAQGDGESNRDGRKVIFKKISVKGVFEIPPRANQTAGGQAPICFVALVWDKQTNSALLNSEDVYQNFITDPDLMASPFRNLQHIQRFQILKSVTVVMPQVEMTYDGTNIETQGVSIPFEMHKDLNIVAHYNGTSADIANSSDNSLHIIAYCNDVSLVPTIAYHSRLRYIG